MDALMQAQHKASEALYKTAGRRQVQPGAQVPGCHQGAGERLGRKPKPEGDVIDAEVVEDDEEGRSRISDRVDLGSIADRDRQLIRNPKSES